MSWPYLTAATRLRLPTTQKIVALALGDFAEVNGRVEGASNARLCDWTGLSKNTVKDALRELGRRTLLSVVEDAVAASSTAPIYRVHYPGSMADPGSVADRGVENYPGSKRASTLGQPLTLNDHALIPKAGKAGKASRRARLEVPTGAQMLKLAATVVDDPDPTTRPTDEQDFVEKMKYACAAANFVYNTASVLSAIHQLFAARGLETFSYQRGRR